VHADCRCGLCLILAGKHREFGAQDVLIGLSHVLMLSPNDVPAEKSNHRSVTKVSVPSGAKIANPLEQST
jgi:hypothetical protein